MNIKKLSFIFIFLLVLVALVLLIDQKKGKKTFRTDLFNADTAEITAIVIYPGADQSKPLTLLKNGKDWIVKEDEKAFSADPGMVKEMLRTLNDMKATRVAATEKARWKEFEVDDSTSTRILVKKGKKTVSALYLGKFSYQMPKNTNPYDYYNRQPEISTYVRVGDEKFVYVTKGFLTMVFNRSLNDFRNKVIIRSNSNDWNRLTFSYPADSSFIMLKDKGQWFVDGIVVDSAKAAEYLSSVAWVSNDDFVDDQKPVSNKYDLSLKIEGDNMVSPIVLTAYAADTTHGYLLHSSENQGVYFSGKKSGLTDRIFVGKTELLSAGE
ncbi:MAG: DUF4340 domain-containing protein [Bacteroidales bacterium]|nr:DUF4340 domain-containing protein [Bacteroidales bacterium]MBN2763956.1 DUF4340 domain-containing protein [Bacteroidales bacterium]